MASDWSGKSRRASARDCVAGLTHYRMNNGVLGFLSGIGYEGGEDVDPLHGMDAKGVWAVWAWIDNYCQAYPLEAITTAAKAFDRAHPH
jgi:hypothetical protein